MSGTTPYLGSKISLVSKAKIRYEGILYTIDTNESTVALAKVRSLGTEDRPTDRPMAARDEVYEYIIFRGSDIEDLHVCEPYSAQKQTNQLPSNLIQDPAIVKTSAGPVFPPSSSSVTSGSATTSSAQPTQSAPSMPVMTTMPTVSAVVGTSSKSSSRDVQQQTGRQQNQNNSKRTSPTTDSGVQVDSDKQDKHIQRDQQRTSTHKENRANNNNNHNQQQQQSNNNTEFNMNRLSYNNNQQQQQRNQNYNNDFNQRGNNQFNQNQNNDFNNQRNRMMNSNSYNQMSNSSSNQNGFRRNNNNNNNGNVVGSQRNNQQRTQQYNNNNNNNNSMTSPRPNNQQVQRNNNNDRRTQRVPTSNSQRVNIEPLKFEGEFNFEEANARFEQEMEKEFTDKLKISTSKSHNDSSLNTSQDLQAMQDQAHMMMKQKVMESDIIKREDSKPNNEMSAEDNKNCYDKSSSFFDRISCESSAKAQTKPKNWKDERKMNVETFGMLLRQSNDMRRNYHRGGNQNYRRPMNQGQYRNQNQNQNQNQNNQVSNNQNNQNGMRYNQNSNNQNNQRNTNGQSTYRRPEVEVGSGYQGRSNNTGYRRYNAGSR